jgi:hypothetical protein
MPLETTRTPDPSGDGRHGCENLKCAKLGQPM